MYKQRLLLITNYLFCPTEHLQLIELNFISVINTTTRNHQASLSRHAADTWDNKKLVVWVAEMVSIITFTRQMFQTLVRDSSNGETVNVKVRQAKWPGKCHNKMLLAHGDVIVSNFQQGQRACQLKAKEVFILKVPRV